MYHRWHLQTIPHDNSRNTDILCESETDCLYSPWISAHLSLSIKVLNRFSKVYNFFKNIFSSVFGSFQVFSLFWSIKYAFSSFVKVPVLLGQSLRLKKSANITKGFRKMFKCRFVLIEKFRNLVLLKKKT